MGGSESRFLLRPISSPLYLVSPNHCYGEKLVLGSRNSTNRYQKVLIKNASSKGYINIRFHNHPQPYVTCDEDCTLFMQRNDKSGYGECKILCSGRNSRRHMVNFILQKPNMYHFYGIIPKTRPCSSHSTTSKQELILASTSMAKQ